ncbi:hypothetical protein IHE31_01525 (plasmid) [Mycetohabitans rhizoxinica]
MTALYGKAGRGIDNLRSALPVVAAQFGGQEDFKQRATALLDLIDIETALRIKSDNHKIPIDHVHGFAIHQLNGQVREAPALI